MHNDSKKRQEKSFATGVTLFFVPHLFCCGLLLLLAFSGVSLNFGSPAWLIMGGLFTALGIGIFLWCAKCTFRSGRK